MWELLSRSKFMESTIEYPSSFNLHSILLLFFLPKGKESSRLRSAFFLHLHLYISLCVCICGEVSMDNCLAHNMYVQEIYDMGPTALLPLRRKAC